MRSISRVTSCLAMLACLTGTSGAGDTDSSKSRSVLYRAAATGRARTFFTAVYLAGLTDTLRDGGPFTLFVPTDEAFAKLPHEVLDGLIKPENQHKLAELLKYHVISGHVLSSAITDDPRPKTLAGPPLTIAANAHGVAVNGATLVQTDLTARNGVVHLIDAVLSLPPDDIIAVAEKAGEFRILRKALDVAGLTDTLRSGGPFTVFAPTDRAFARLGKNTIEDLLKDKQRLAQILKYHVVARKLSVSQLLKETRVDTLLPGQKIIPSVKGSRVRFNNSLAVDGDIESSNGIIHVIDRVLIPSENG